jgi:hypothetical protein
MSRRMRRVWETGSVTEEGVLNVVKTRRWGHVPEIVCLLRVLATLVVYP